MLLYNNCHFSAWLSTAFYNHLCSCCLEISYLQEINTSKHNPQLADTLLTLNASTHCIWMTASCMSNLIISHMPTRVYSHTLTRCYWWLCKVPDHCQWCKNIYIMEKVRKLLFRLFLFLKERSVPSSYSFLRLFIDSNLSEDVKETVEWNAFNENNRWPNLHLKASIWERE